jgi:hypothetical protein
MVHAHCYWYHHKDYLQVKNGHGKKFFSWKKPLAKVGIHLTVKAYYPEDSLSDTTKFSKLMNPSNPIQH